MGFFDFIKSGWDSFKKGVSSVADTIKQGAITIFRTVGAAVTTVHQDLRDLVGGVGAIANRGVAAVEGVADKLITTAGATVSSLGSSLALPLGIGAAAVGLYFLTQKKA
jgi:phage-related protein